MYNPCTLFVDLHIQKNKLKTEVMKVYKSALPEMSIKYKSGNIKKAKIASSSDIYELLKDMYDQDTIEYNESIIIVYMNGANNTIGWTRHTSGGIACTVVDQRMILAEALLCGASSLLMSHNHPSGQLFPSKEDENVTKKVSEACKIMGIRFLDHIIVSGDLSGYYSFADEGKI